MILLDTNVLSELTKPRPSARVLAWLVHRMRVATRDVGDFKASGVSVVNPWE